MLFGLQHSPGVFSPGGQLTAGRIEAAGLALALTLLVSARVRALHPPSGSTAMIVVLGGFRVALPEVVAVAGEVVAIASFGEVLRRTHLVGERDEKGGRP
jgi:HPP family